MAWTVRGDKMMEDAWRMVARWSNFIETKAKEYTKPTWHVN